ncbi:MAG TPA: transglycosylase SLT domain-containing protein [Rhodocyclaceae bacterium]|nr:transglycosylase SLT domain-containing protein [Rhodocyclaceae bacterium]
MIHRFVSVLAILLAFSIASAHGRQGDERILAAREALRTGDRATLERLAATPDDHLLDAYVEYWLLVNMLARPEAPPADRLIAFIDRHRDGVAAERLRAYWLQRLAKDGDWVGFLHVFREHERPDAELRCLAWQARRATGDARVLAEVAAQWRELLDAPDACQPVMREAALGGQVSEDEVWWRFRRQIDSRTPQAARTTLAWLPAGRAPELTQLDRLVDSPSAFIDRLRPNFAVRRGEREFALAALIRLAREDARAAHQRLSRLYDRLEHDERGRIYAVLGLHGAQSRLPEADDWFRAAGSVDMTAAQRAWRVRAALRIENWHRVEATIASLDAAERDAPEWVYWLARAHAARGRHDAARALYERIAGEAHFYGMLAADELGRSFMPPPDDAVAARDRTRVANDPAIARALAFYRLGLTTEATREWIHALRGRDRGFLLAAAHHALANQLYDRAINTAELADPNANFEIRFIAPYRELIEPQVRSQGLDLAWVYGLMRQESRFIVPARSSAGAQGLMQVMPATGKWVAKRIGLSGYHPRMLGDPDTNVLLGTSYMRIILSGLDNHPVLASAGYNAGPGRARRWRDERPIEAAIYAETIPFDETRDYVKKVLANAVIYAAMFERRPQSLKARLDVIAPGSETDS